jgi:processing peptidase subunit beta
MTVFKNDVNRAVSMLGDSVSNAVLDAGEFELLKGEIAADLANNQNDLQYTLLEQAHYNSFRDHMMGQPIKGDADVISSLTTDDLRNFKAANYFGDNMVVVGTGNINHEEFVAQVNNAFQNVGKDAQATPANQDKCVYVPALMFVRDDEMYNSNIGVFYDAPTPKHEDYYGFLLLKHMFGSYRIDKNAEHLNDVKKQYNSMHALLGDLVDVTMADSHYFAYSDCALFGNYFFGNEVFTRQMNYCGTCLPTMYAHYVNDVEVVRGRNHLWNTLLNQESTQAINKEVGSQLLSMGRRIHRSEIAARVSHMDNYHIKNLAYKWFYDAEPCWTNWGPVETTAIVGSYKYFKINTLGTVTNAHHSLYN